MAKRKTATKRKTQPRKQAPANPTAPPPDPIAQNMISHCTIIGTQYDAATVDVMSKIAQGLIVNAGALMSLTQSLEPTRTPVIKIGGEPPTTAAVKEHAGCGAK